MRTKLLSALIALTVILNIFSICPVRGASTTIGDFEDDTAMWTDAAKYTDDAFGGTACGLVTGVIDASSFSAIFSCVYNDTISIKEGQTYSVEFYVKSAGTSSLTVPVSHVYLSGASDNIVVNVSKISSQWEKATAMFYAGRSGDFSLSMMFYTYSDTAQILIDDVNIKEQKVKLSSMKIEGKKNAFIPVSGTEEYSFRSYAVDTDGNKISLLTGIIEPDLPLPEGVSFSSNSGVLYVESSASSGSEIILRSIPPYGFEDIPVTPFKVILDKNFIKNSSFDETESIPWDVQTNFSLTDDGKGNSFLKVSAIPGETSSDAALSLSDTLYLQSNTLYVFRARVRSDGDCKTRLVSSGANVDYGSYEINVCVSNIGSDSWSDVCAATYVETDGMYKLNLSLSSLGGSEIYIDNTLFQEEILSPSGIAFSAPAHISIPEKQSLEVPINCAVHDQFGNFLTDEPVEISISPSSDEVYIEGHTLRISSAASDNVYKIVAISSRYPAISGTHVLVINHENVGDGSFEAYAPGQWWATSPPSSLLLVSRSDSYTPADGMRMARLVMNGNISALFADSYKKYFSGNSYVFTADIKKTYSDIQTVATAIVYNSNESEFENNLFAAQFEVDNVSPIQYIFMPNFDITGRLMIAFNTPEEHTSQEVLLDNIRIEPAYVSASNVNISGAPYTDKAISGNYRFSANFNTSDISSYRWLISPTEKGVYTSLENQTEQSLSITSDMEGKYIKFEVTPIALDGPVTGTPITSSPVRIKKYTYGSTYEEIPEETDDPPVETPPTDTPPQQNEPTKHGDIIIKNIYSSSNYTKNVFADTLTHWAKKDIDTLYGSGIVNGTGNSLFMPDATVSRAEFTTFLIRAFDLAPMVYTDSFSDVHGYKWYSGAIETAVKYGLAYGVGNDLFLPESPITREQMFSMIMRAMKKAGAILTDKPADLNYVFSDASYISEWARYDLASAYTLGLVNGSDGRISPSSFATRAESAAVIKRMIDYILNDFGVK